MTKTLTSKHCTKWNRFIGFIHVYKFGLYFYPLNFLQSDAVSRSGNITSCLSKRQTLFVRRVENMK